MQSNCAVLCITRKKNYHCLCPFGKKSSEEKKQKGLPAFNNRGDWRNPTQAVVHIARYAQLMAKVLTMTAHYVGYPEKHLFQRPERTVSHRLGAGLDRRASTHSSRFRLDQQLLAQFLLLTDMPEMDGY